MSTDTTPTPRPTPATPTTPPTQTPTQTQPKQTQPTQMQATALATRSNITPRLGGPEWLHDWDRENPETWDRRLAWTTLAITTYTLTLSFVTWFLVSAVAPKLNSIGFTLSKDELYWLAAMPGLAGGLLRLVWMFLPPVVGTRKLVSATTLLLVIPLSGWAWAVRDPATSYSTLMGLAFLCGIGGGAFSGFMPSKSYLHNAGMVFLPWVVVGAVAAWLYLRSIPIQANFRQQLDISARNTPG